MYEDCDSIIVIPAIKKNVAFPDDLIKKLCGITLIQRVIDKALELNQKVFVVTDSEEIQLIAHRSNILVDLDAKRESHFFKKKENVIGLLKKNDLKSDFVIELSPYSPLLRLEEIKKAYKAFKESDAEELRTYKVETRPVSRFAKGLSRVLQEECLLADSMIELNSLTIYRNKFSDNKESQVFSYVLPKEMLEINSYHDWWVCEKVFKRRRIVFRLIGNLEVGMGHIFRALSLAHEIVDHEVIFVCSKEDRNSVLKLAGNEYWIEAVEQCDIPQRILALEPDLVINDQLNTEIDYIQILKNNNIKVANFEDLGPAASLSDLTINELFDSPQYESSNTLWGHHYSFLRDEFEGAVIKESFDRVECILVTFGGTDPSNYTLKCLKVLAPFCDKKNIKIHVVCGPGYAHQDELNVFLNSNLGKDILYTNGTGVISKIMEKVDFAICSNGRTVYELAHMHIPAIVFSHHEREETHKFSSEENGFISFKKFNESSTADFIRYLNLFINNFDYRGKLFKNISKHDFSANKTKVVQALLQLIDT